MLLFHVLLPPKLFAMVVDRSLLMPEGPMFVLFARTLCTEVAFAAMVDAIPEQESKLFSSSMYSNGRVRYLQVNGGSYRWYVFANNRSTVL